MEKNDFCKLILVFVKLFSNTFLYVECGILEYGIPRGFPLESASHSGMSLNFSSILDECLKGFIPTSLLDRRGSDCERNIANRTGFLVMEITI